MPTALRDNSGFRGFLIIRGANEIGIQMLNVAIGWYVYAATRDPMSLAFVGLAQFLPQLCLSLIAGDIIDRFERRAVIAVSFAIQLLLLTAFAIWAEISPPSAAPVYVLLAAMGAARAFSGPASAAILPQIAPGEAFPRAIAIASWNFQICVIAGPALGGLIYAVSGTMVFAVIALLFLVVLSRMATLPAGRAEEPEDLAEEKGALAGLRYICAQRYLLGLMSLDLFAVLFGGCTALLPIYAREILMVGPFGLGCLRCASGIGAASVGLLLMCRPVAHSDGRLMLVCVAGYGAATALFALSQNVWLSLAALAIGGGFDMVSMVIRQIMVQLSTPDAMRGRVSAVNDVFIGASSELGEFESGAAASLIGAVPAAFLGGAATLIVVALWSRMFPELRGESAARSDRATITVQETV